MNPSNLKKTHQWMKPFLKDATVIDMTAGNGHDTLFLAQHAKHVYAVDIQAQAIEATKKRTADYPNVETILQDHSALDFTKLKPLNGAIYNLGYLPSGDKSIITKTKTTIKSLHKLLPHLKDFLVITCYPRHPGGQEEADAVQTFIASLNLPTTTFTYDKPLTPITYCVDLQGSLKQADHDLEPSDPHST